MRAKPVLLSLVVLLAGSAALLAEAPRVRMVFLADSNDRTFGKTYHHNAEMMAEVFKEANLRDPQKPYDTPILLEGDRMTVGETLRAIAGLPVRPGVDTVAFFYWGHGSADERGDHYFAPRYGREVVRRSRIVEAIQARHPRLTVVVSDTCNAITESVKEIIIGRAPLNWRAVRALFIEQRGLLDVNSCNLGQYSWNVTLRSREQVSIFSKAFTDALYSDRARALATPTAPADWPTFMRVVSADTNRLFKEYNLAAHPEAKKLEQTSQDPCAWSLPKPLIRPDEEKPPPGGGDYAAERGVRKVPLALPLHVQLRSTADGLVVAKVLHGGPAERAGLRAGDVLTAVNGRKMTFAQYNAFRTATPSPRQAVFTIVQCCDCGCGKLLKDCKELCSGERTSATRCDNIHGERDRQRSRRESTFDGRRP